MNEWAKTGIFVAAAAAISAIAFFTAPRTSRETSSFVEDREPFTQESNPERVKGLEVTGYDKDVAAIDNFSVKLENGVWVIPSHNNYPADAQDRLKKTAGALLTLIKDSVVSDNKETHKDYGVIDPSDTAGGPESWGTRVKLTDADGNVVSDLIIGKDVTEKPNFKYVRVPDADRVYQVDCAGLEISTSFTDWINTSLIEDSSFSFDEVQIRDYRLVPSGDRVTIEDSGTIEVKKVDNKWKLTDLKEGEETDETKAGDLANAIGELKIVGVRPKPPGLTPDLNVVEANMVLEEMVRRGFIPAKDGRVVSSEGEVRVETTDGIYYTLRLGGVFLGRGEEVEAGKKDEAALKDGQPPEGEKAPDVQENRFLLVSVGFDESRFPPIEPPPGVEAPKTPAEGESKPAEPGAAPPAPPAADGAQPPAESKPEQAPPETKPAETAPSEPKPSEGSAVPASPPQLQNIAYQEPEKSDAPAAQPAADPKPAEPAPTNPASQAPAADAPKDAPAGDKPVDQPALSPEEAQKKAEEEAKAKAEEEKRKLEAAKAEYEQKKAERDRKIADGRKKQKELEERYGRWFYVVSNDAAKKIRVTRESLVKKPEKKEGEAAATGTQPGEPGAEPKPAGETAPGAGAPPTDGAAPAEGAQPPATGETAPAEGEKPADAEKTPAAPDASAPPSGQAPAPPAGGATAPGGSP